MQRIRLTMVAVAALALASSAGLRADVKTEEKSQVKFEGALGRMFSMFGGKAAREGLVTKVAVMGDRKLSISGDVGQLVDLGEQKVYDIDFKKSSYTVTTFDELRRRIKEAQEKARAEQEKQQQQAEKAGSGEKPPEYEIDVVTKPTGQTKNLNGFETKEVVTTVTVRQKGQTVEGGGGMVLTNDAWLAPTVAAMKDVIDFERRYWKLLDAPMAGGLSAEQMAAAAAMYPMLADALKRVKTEGAAVEGTPIQSTMLVEAVQSPEQAKQQAEKDESGGGGGLGGMLARKMMKKKETEGAPGTPGRTRVMTMTHEVLSVTAEVAATDVAVPAGFKEKK